MSEQGRGLTDDEIMGIMKGAVKTAITYNAANAIIATVSILRAEKAELRQLLGDLVHAADHIDWDYKWCCTDEYDELLKRIYEILGEDRE